MKKLLLLLTLLCTSSILFYSCNKNLTKEAQPTLVKNNQSATGEIESVVQKVQVRPQADRNAKQAAATFTPISDVSGDYLSSTKLIDLSTLACFSQVSSVSDGDLTISFSSTMQKRIAGNTTNCYWSGSWGSPPVVESNNPNVLFSSSQNSMTLLFSKAVSTFGYELQPNLFRSYPYTAEFYNGSTLVGSITRIVSSGRGDSSDYAKLFAASTDQSFDKIIISTSDQLPSLGLPSGFGIAQFRYSAETKIPVDIKPLSCPNTLNTKSKGVTPVAILGTANFDVNNVDLSTIKLNGVSPNAGQVRLEELAAPYDKTTDCDCSVTAPDAFQDINLKFDSQALSTSLGNVSDGQQVTLTLTCKTKSGKDLIGKDCIIVKK